MLKESLGFSLSSSTIYNKKYWKNLIFVIKILAVIVIHLILTRYVYYTKVFYIKKTCSFWVLEKNSYSQKTSLLNDFKIFFHSSILMNFSKNYKSIYPKYYCLKWMVVYPLKIIFRNIKICLLYNFFYFVFQIF